MKIRMLLALLAISTLANGQKLVVTPVGLRDANDNEKTYVVINADGLTAKQLYDYAIKYINKNYKSPEDVIKGTTEGEYLKFITHVPNFLIILNSGVKVEIEADYTTELSFKDGRVKYEIVALDMYNSAKYKLEFSQGGLVFFIYNKKGELKRPDTKTEIETYFNSQISSLTQFLTGKGSDDDW